MVKIGVLGLQGDFLEHIEMLKEMHLAEPILVKDKNDLNEIDALIIPGGESTALGKLMELRGLKENIVELAKGGLPILGTCAGAILLAKRVTDKNLGKVEQPLLALMNIHVVRNAFGRQKESFEALVDIEELGKIRAAFIRAPIITETWAPANIIGYLMHPRLGKVGVTAIQNNMLALTFHPEIKGEAKIYKLLIDMAKGRI